MITPVGQRTRIGPQPKDYNKDLTCEYHQGEVGHTVENCRVLRHRIQDLLDQGVLKFRIEGVINTIGAEKSDEVDITSTKIPWEPLFHELKKRGLLTTPRAPKGVNRSRHVPVSSRGPRPQPTRLRRVQEGRQTSKQGWKELKRISRNSARKRKEELGKLTPATPLEMSKPDPVVIQYATKEKVMLQTASVSTVQSSEKVPSVVIQVPQPFPYHDNKRVPWNYGMKIISTREDKPKIEEEVVGNLTSGLGGITRSGRCYTPEELEKRRKEIGKTVEDPAKTKVAEDEAADFLRIIKSSEYSVVKQLSKMPSHISVLALLLASESHRKALLKVLNEAYVPEDITGPSFENMVTSILVTNQLTFSDDELPPEGRGHAKALYISVKTNDRIVSRVLIDNGSALNVCPLSTLEKLDIDPTRVRVNSMIVRAFDGTRREVLGRDRPASRGRPWLHTAGAVPSSLHQKMKLIIGNQLVTILAEEPISIYNDGEIPYIDGCAFEEASFHSFEFVTVIHRVAAVEPRLSRAGIMVAKEFVKAGISARTRVRLHKPRKNCNRKELRQSSEERKWPEKKMVIPHIRTTFPASAMFQVDEGDVDELALLFAEDLNVNAITTEGDSTAFPIHPDQCEEIDLEGLLDEEDLKGYRIEEETSDEDLGEDANLPNLPPHLVTSRGLETLEFEMFCEHEDPESHLQRYRRKMALYTDNEILMISMFHESLPECAVTWFYQLKNIACWEDLARAFLDRYRHNLKAPPPSNITTATAEEEYAGPMVEGLSIHTIAEEEDSTTPPTRHCQQGEEVKTWTCVPLLQRVSSSNEQDEGSKPNIEELEIVNLADEGEEPREVKIGTRCATEQKEALIALLREFHEIFAWSYQDMPGLDTDIVVHKIPLKPECKPVKQALRRMKPEVILKIKEEGGKAIEGRMCVDYRDLNRASPKDNFPLPHIDTLVDNTATNVVFSFMDGFSGYNQIKMAEEDKSKTAFVTHWGTFVYDVMPFGLKNAGATYQRAMVTLFHDMIHHEIEVYVDDMIAKSRTAQDHLTDLRKAVPATEEVSAQIEPEQVCLRRHIRKVIRLHHQGVSAQPTHPGSTNSRTSPHSYTSQSKKHPWAACWDNKTRLGKKEQAIYYLSKKFTEPETRYLLVEKTCCALAWASKKLRQYMLYYTTWLVSRMDPIKYIFEKPALTGKIARWQVLLSEFDILFVARKAIKGQAIADYLADYPSEQWKLYFDGAANAVGSGIGAVLVSPKGQQTPIAVKLGFDCTNNMTELTENGKARDPKLIPYQRYISRLVPKFKYITFTYTPRAHNHFADALATLASLIKLVEGDDVRPLRIETRDIPAYCVCVEECMNVEAEIDNKPWYYDIKRFIQDREYPPRATENEKKYIRRNGLPMQKEANRLIQEMHAGLMGAHANGPFLARKIMRAGYYWLTMERDCIRHVQTCHKCQMYQNSKNAPPQYLHTMASPWPFSAWGMDVIGAITPKASNGHEFILVAIDYFTKWVEACSFKNVTQVAVTRFVKNNIICRYGMPEMLITDNASNLNNRMMDQLCQQFKIQHHNSAPYRPKMNGAVEAANKNVKKILSKMTETYKDWHEHLPYALCAYRTSVRTSVGAYLPTLCSTRDGIERAYNKKARPRTFQPGDLVLKKRNMALSDPRGKFAPSYEGPYVVKKAFSGGAIILADMDGEEFRSPINSDSVIKPGKQRKSVRTLPSDGNYHGYGENLGRGAIGKSNVESWTWRKLRVIYG
uniref:Integrase catalytic domain-containing protein n=1 Tax=Fagus sylvatica TaxID=28930 RepID=A0A2N9GA71_FAGSY